MAGSPSPTYQSALELQLKSPYAAVPTKKARAGLVCAPDHAVTEVSIGRSSDNRVVIVRMLSFVSEWLLVVEVSWTSDGGAVDGGSLCGLLQRSPSVPAGIHYC